MSFEPATLVEVWADLGPPRPAQKYKVMMDAVKVLLVESVLFPAGARKILELADDEAASHFRGSSWMAEALRGFESEILVVELPVAVRDRIGNAQRRQSR